MNDYRHVVVHVGDSARTNELLACAARLAAAQGASVHAVYAVAPLPLGHYLSAETATAAAALKLEVERKRIQKAHERVLEASRESGRPIEFEPPGGDPLEVMTARSRLADLVLVGQPSHTDADAPPRSFVSRLLVAAGCPVLLVPEVGRHDPCGSRVLVAWSGTRESARAARCVADPATRGGGRGAALRRRRAAGRRPARRCGGVPSRARRGGDLCRRADARVVLRRTHADANGGGHLDRRVAAVARRRHGRRSARHGCLRPRARL
jgi:nucleotide-binding universal stress UspA family protein